MPEAQAVVLTALALTGFITAQLFVARLGGDDASASAALSFASGVAVAYVVLQVLPELEHHRRGLGLPTDDARALPLRPDLHLVALAGVVAFYLLERWLRDEWVPAGDGEPCEPRGPGFWAHLAVFALYTGFFAHQLHRYAASGVGEIVLHGFALSLHFLTAANALRRDYGGRYDRVARWLLALAAGMGWLSGLLFRLPGEPMALLFAFLAGGLLLNVLKEELPAERRSRVLPLLLGVGGYAAMVAVGGIA
jgi:zinc transporter ZupT